MLLRLLLLLSLLATPAFAQRPTDYPPHMRRLVNGWGTMLGLVSTCSLRPEPWVATLRGQIATAAREMARSPDEVAPTLSAVAQQEAEARTVAQQQGRAYCDAVAGPLLPIADDVVAGRANLATVAARTR